MSEGNKKSGGNFKAQSAVTIGRNKRLKGERHARRMLAQAAKRPYTEDGMGFVDLAVPRGTARDLRRKPVQAHYAKVQSKLAEQATA